jgi:hypothetical protein
VQYFLNGIARQSEDALSRAERLNQLITDWRDKLSGQAGTKVALQLFEMAAGNPFVTPRGAQDKLGVAYNTVMHAIGQLEKLKVLKEVSEAGSGLLREGNPRYSGRTRTPRPDFDCLIRSMLTIGALHPDETRPNRTRKHQCPSHCGADSIYDSNYANGLLLTRTE